MTKKPTPDRTARVLALAALAVALLALVVAGLAASAASDYASELRSLGEALGSGSGESLPMGRPPPSLDTDDF